MSRPIARVVVVGRDAAGWLSAFGSAARLRPHRPRRADDRIALAAERSRRLRRAPDTRQPSPVARPRRKRSSQRLRGRLCAGPAILQLVQGKARLHARLRHAGRRHQPCRFHSILGQGARRRSRRRSGGFLPRCRSRQAKSLRAGQRYDARLFQTPRTAITSMPGPTYACSSNAPSRQALSAQPDRSLR